MKKVLYVLGACLLSILIYSEVQRANEKEKMQETVNVTSSADVASSKVAYLTFDDGPSEITPEILDTLKEKKVNATFFLVGNEITPEREVIVKRELAEGHQVGVHTYTHKKEEMYCDETLFFNDFQQCKNRIEEVTGEEVTLHRFPWGSNNGYVCPMVDDLLEQLKSQGITSFDWNVSGEDSVSRDVAKATIYQNVAKDLEKHNAPIILLHDSNTMENTAAVLGEIIDMIREKGYEFGTLDQREGYTFPAAWR